MYETVAQTYAAEFCGQKKCSLLSISRNVFDGERKDVRKKDWEKLETSCNTVKQGRTWEIKKWNIHKSYRCLLESSVTLGNSSKKKMCAWGSLQPISGVSELDWGLGNEESDDTVRGKERGQTWRALTLYSSPQHLIWLGVIYRTGVPQRISSHCGPKHPSHRE